MKTMSPRETGGLSTGEKKGIEPNQQDRKDTFYIDRSHLLEMLREGNSQLIYYKVSEIDRGHPGVQDAARNLYERVQKRLKDKGLERKDTLYDHLLTFVEREFPELTVDGK